MSLMNPRERRNHSPDSGYGFTSHSGIQLGNGLLKADHRIKKQGSNLAVLFAEPTHRVKKLGMKEWSISFEKGLKKRRGSRREPARMRGLVQAEPSERFFNRSTQKKKPRRQRYWWSRQAQTTQIEWFRIVKAENGGAGHRQKKRMAEGGQKGASCR